MEFLRFGSSIPGSYWGCCAADIIQNFKFDPDAKASIQLVSGDGGGPVMGGTRKPLFAGPTYKDIFLQRLRSGTFHNADMPNHAFIAILTDWQITSGYGAQWLAILKENGFEYIRSVSNSVYTGPNLGKYSGGRGEKRNYIFMLVRNIGTTGDGDALTPPKEWTDLPQVKAEAWEAISPDTRKEICKFQHAADTEVWNRIGKPKFLTEEEVVKAGAPIILAGQRVEWAKQQTKEARAAAKKQSGLFKEQEADPFATPAPVMKVAG